MASHLYDLTSTDLQYFIGFHRSVDSSIATLSLNRAASKVNSALKRWDVTPSAITNSSWPDDYQHLRDLILEGAVAYYTFSTSGNTSSVQEMLGSFRDGVRELWRDPAFLDVYSRDEGGNTVTSHTTSQTTTEINEGTTNRMRSPDDDRRQWETM